VVGYFGCYGTVNIPSTLSWRLPLLLLAVYSLAFTVMAVFVLPESPRWLMSCGNGERATAIWTKLGVEAAARGTIAESQLETLEADQQGTGIFALNMPLPNEMKQVGSLEALLNPSTRPQLLAALFLMGMVQMSGIDGVLFVCIPVETIRSYP
jgi:hypothetical protein